jgi:antitoxin ParD1/3/4
MTYISELSDQQQRFIERQVASGHYSSAPEVIAAALRLLEAREERLRALDAAIDEGCGDLDGGATIDAASVFDELEQTYRPPGAPGRRG